MKKNKINLKDSLDQLLGLKTKVELIKFEKEICETYSSKISILDNSFDNVDEGVREARERLSDIRASRASMEEIANAREQLNMRIDTCIINNYRNTSNEIGAIISFLNDLVKKYQHLDSLKNIVPIANRRQFEHNKNEFTKNIVILETKINELYYKKRK